MLIYFWINFQTWVQLSGKNFLKITSGIMCHYEMHATIKWFIWYVKRIYINQLPSPSLSLRRALLLWKKIHFAVDEILRNSHPPCQSPLENTGFLNSNFETDCGLRKLSSVLASCSLLLSSYREVSYCLETFHSGDDLLQLHLCWHSFWSVLNFHAQVTNPLD